MSSLLIDYNEYGKWYNQWLDTASEFKKGYRDHQNLHRVATAIIDRVESGLKLPESDPMHSFARYGSYDKTIVANLATLAQDIMAEFQNPHLRQYVVSFFHSGGANHEELEDLFDLFTEFCDHAVIRDPEDESDDESESEEDEEEGEEDANAQEQSTPSNEWTQTDADWGQPAVEWSWGPSETYSYGPNDPNILY
jgi:hypothetical protein